MVSQQFIRIISSHESIRDDQTINILISNRGSVSYGVLLGVQKGSEGFGRGIWQNSIKVLQKEIEMKRRADLNRSETLFLSVPGHNQGIRVLARDHIYPLKQSVSSYDAWFDL